MKEKLNPAENNQSVFGANPITDQQEAEEYFETLPKYIQENIMQSGLEIQSVNHLKELSEHYKTED